jgi:hypothetical protein
MRPVRALCATQSLPLADIATWEDPVRHSPCRGQVVPDDPLKEDAMKRFLFSVAIAVFAVSAMLTPSAPAQAGFKGRLAIGLALGAIALSHQRFEERRHHRVRRTTRKAHVARRRHRSRRSGSRSYSAYPTYQPYVRPYRSADSYLGYQH